LSGGRPHARAVLACQRGGHFFGHRRRSGLDSGRGSAAERAARRHSRSAAEVRQPRAQLVQGPRPAAAGRRLVPIRHGPGRLEPSHSCRVHDQGGANVVNAYPRVGALVETPQDGLAVFARRRRARAEGRRHEPRLLHHTAFLLFQELRLVHVEVEDSRDGQKHDEQVEREDLQSDARRRHALHRSGTTNRYPAP
jgi:hypothetical protein